MSYKRFLDHLEVCGGCTGEKRTFERCEYALHCATVEVLEKKGLIRNSEELISYGSGCRDSSDLIDTEERNRPRASLYGIRPCNSD